MFGLTGLEYHKLARLTTPAKVQGFLNTIPIRGPGGTRCRSPRVVLRERQAHCLEGAMLAALVLRLQGRPPWLMDLRSNQRDFDHVVALFRERGLWGAISHTNYAVLKYREPIYKSLRELAMSYFHEYFTNDGRKNLRSYSGAYSLRPLDKNGWMTAEDDVWFVPQLLDRAKHYPVLSLSARRRLRRADPIEIKAGKLRVWPQRQVVRIT